MYLKSAINKISNRLDRFASKLVKGKVVFKGKASRDVYSSVEDLVDMHFKHYSSETHVSRTTLDLALHLLGGKSANIIETGSSAWGTNSSLLFDGYVNSFGGSFKTVDVRLQPCLSLRDICSSKTELYCDDSVSFLNTKLQTQTRIDLVYLDSWDVDWKNPVPSAIHGLKEFLAISDKLRNGSLLLIDDTPADLSIMGKVQPKYKMNFEDFREIHGFYPGKGALIKQLLLSTGRGRKIAHEYQLLWQF